MSDTIAAELEARHAEARRAFEARDISAYRSLFSPALVYRQHDGKVIGRDSLMRDVAQQLHSLSRVDSVYRTEALVLANGEATETLTQNATLEATAFGILRRSWVLSRRGDYTWINESGVWVIRRVEVTSESLINAGWRVGKRR